MAAKLLGLGEFWAQSQLSFFVSCLGFMTHSASGKLPLMIVDDESDNLDLLDRTFRRSFAVYRANSALEALQLLDEAGEMAVIISDQRMPQMNGTDFLSKTVDRFPDTMRILLTGYSDVQDLVGAINHSKVFKYITKPWDPEELRQTVQQAGEIYQVVKQRTAELHRALRRESALNEVMSAIRESLDYRSVLQAIVRTFHTTFALDVCLLYPTQEIESSFAPEDDSLETTAQKPLCFPQTFPDFLSEESPKTFLEAFPVLSSQQFPSANNGSIKPAILPSNSRDVYTLAVPLCDPRDAQEQLAVLLLLGRNAWSSEEVDLIETVAAQVALALSQAKLYQQLQVQTEQMRSQLAIAQQVQASLLRQTLPELEQARIQAVTIPAQEIGGDFFEVYEHPDGHVWLAVGDVSGKGVPAALLMASTISLLRRELTQEMLPTPDEVLQKLNHNLFQELVGSSCLITIALGCYTPATGEFIYANAGHVFPIVWSRSNQEEAAPNYLKVRSVPLGILPLWQAESGKLMLNQGDVVLLVSDGITEAELSEVATQNSLSGANSSPTSLPLLRSAGLWEILRQRSSFDLNDVLAEIRGQCPVQDDDQTLLTLEVL